MTHPFLLTSGAWLGEGKIKLNHIAEILVFYTRWKVSEKDESGIIEATQEIEVRGLSDKMHSSFAFSKLTESAFEVVIENEAMGKVHGAGILTPESISWELRDPAAELEGLEYYEKQDDGTYTFKADYATSDDFRTEINGKIWKKES